MSLGRGEGDGALPTNPLELEDSPRTWRGQRQVLFCWAGEANSAYWVSQLLDAIMGIIRSPALPMWVLAVLLTSLSHLQKQAGCLSLFLE